MLRHVPAGKRVLVVDDEPMLLWSLRLCLESLGCLVDTSSNGVDAMNKLNEGRFDIAITDNKMPHMDGCELALRIKRQSPNLPVLMVTGVPTPNAACLRGPPAHQAVYKKRASRCHG